MRRFGMIAFLLVAGAVTGCDHATKHLAATQLPRGGRQIVAGILDLRAVGNTDTAFSLIGDLVPVHTRALILTILMCIFVALVSAIIVKRWRQSPWMERLGFALLLGGALGNTIDRLVRGYVVDFIHIHYWPVFNVADIALTVAAGVLLWLTYTPCRPPAPTRGPT
jgi:signal peptidase II